MIPYGDIRKSAPASDTPRDRASRRRTAATIDLFGGPASTHGRRLDFNAPAATAARSSGMGVSFADAYAPSWKAEMAQRDEHAARIDKLPQAVQRLSTEQGVTDLSLLETVAAVHRKSAAMGGQKVQLFASDLGRALGIPSANAEALLTEATKKGFIASFPGSYWSSRT